MTAAKTWTIRDLVDVARSGSPAILPVALLNRLTREVIVAFDASPTDVACELGPELGSDKVGIKATFRFPSVDPYGKATVGVVVEQLDRTWRVSVGGQADTAMPGSVHTFGWADPTPPEFFVTLFSCALESLRTKRRIG